MRVWDPPLPHRAGGGLRRGQSVGRSSGNCWGPGSRTGFGKLSTPLILPICIVKCLDLLKPGGRLVFICSDTLLTIPTMAGLRAWLQSMCDIQVAEVPGSFEDTNQNMILLTLTKQYEASQLTMFGTPVPLADVEATPNMSWRIDRNLARYFGGGVTLGDKMVATSGTTIGNNDLLGLVTTRVLRAVTEPPLHISTVSGTSPSE